MPPARSFPPPSRGARRPGSSRLRNAMLEAYGIPVVPEQVAETAAEAVSAAAYSDCPQSSKARFRAHKTETGGVAVGLESEAEVREAAERIGLPVLVQPLISGSAELLAGVVQDRSSGRSSPSAQAASLPS